MPIYRLWRCSACRKLLAVGALCAIHPSVLHNAILSEDDFTPEEVAAARLWDEQRAREAKKHMGKELTQRELEQAQRNDYLEALTKQLKGRP